MRRSLVVRAAGLVGVMLLTGGSALLVSGCPEPPPEVPEACDVQMVTLRIYAADNINPSEGGRPRPVVVRLYQLVNDLKMQNASYDPILLEDEETLGDDVVQKDEVVVFPNDLVEVKFERNPDAAFLAGAAMFRDPQGHSWKTFYEFPPMPNANQACGAAEVDAGEPQAFVETAFFVVERKIDNGSQFDESMFPSASAIRRMNLPKRSAAPDTAAAK
jgi:type VI secretion system protein VasD